ncbi:hypothetical protein TIFTF001_023898 [Ficus carica]|uniref:ARM repeat superfamily protein n=1 Tax=Ficus carica TaxID=3494 RepID=A0AA88AMH8_FICCA|nr:hypothetical protein TIFTF001_023898 [Ficus carica]
MFATSKSGSIKTGALLLSSCWKHYSVLLRLEDHKVSHRYKELLEQYLSGLQFYTDNHAGGHSENKDSAAETRKFFLNCICLLLGRFNVKKFENMISEHGMRISHVILPQLHSVDEDVIEAVVCILKAVIFKPHSHTDERETDMVLPLLINLLNEQDGTARAVVMLLAEYCLMRKDGRCLEEVLKRLDSRIVQQRKNAIEVISELIRISSDSTTVLSLSSWQDIAQHLLKHLEDEEPAICEQVSNLLPMIVNYNILILHADPSMILPSLVQLVYSLDKRVQSCSSDALVRVLKYHNQRAEVICLLLDCLGSISQSLDLQKATGDVADGSKLENDQVLKLISEWSRSVHNWDVVIGPLIDKMFAEPSNATIVRFLSLISRHLAETADTVLNHVLLHTKAQMDMDETSYERESRTITSDDSTDMQQLLFEHLCPLLIVRMLPLSVFNDLNSSVMYGRLNNQDYGEVKIFGQECVASLLFKRAFYKFEFEDVRRLAAELCGRIHPKVLIPIVRSQLEHAVNSRDSLKIKTCLFSVCTSLVVRGRDSLSQPAMHEVRKSLEEVLIWPSQDEDEVSRAQHGCIDCLALMICADLQASESFTDSKQEKNEPVVAYVISRLISDKNEPVSTSTLGGEICTFGAPVPLPFRLCMANVLISACQKISDSGKKRLAKKALPRLISSVEAIKESDIRAACLQVFFSAVYHLKSVVCPYACDLLKLSLKALKKGSEKEKMGGAKLMASLMGSEDEILASISGGLIEARAILSSVSLTDPSVELRQICSKLLACITYP